MSTQTCNYRIIEITPTSFALIGDFNGTAIKFARTAKELADYAKKFQLRVLIP